MKKAVLAILSLLLLSSAVFAESRFKNMAVKKIDVDTENMAAIDAAFETLEFEDIDCCDWPDKYTYRPETKFKIFHTGEFMVIRYFVHEKYTAAVFGNDGDSVCKDSCVEFFIAPESNRRYYNFETNCIGKMFIGYKDSPSGHGIDPTEEVFSMIRRYPSLGTETFKERVGDNSWTLTLVVPAKALYADNLESWSGLECKMNFFKCGWELSEPSSMSWSKIVYPRQRFHVPAYFGIVYFEK